jgi:hypothetical protein
VVARDPARPKAAHIPDLDFLSACRAHADGRARHPLEVFTKTYPGKVVMSKVAKMRQRGLVTPDWHPTAAGLATLADAEVNAGG